MIWHKCLVLHNGLVGDPESFAFGVFLCFSLYIGKTSGVFSCIRYVFLF